MVCLGPIQVNIRGIVLTNSPADAGFKYNFVMFLMEERFWDPSVPFEWGQRDKARVC